LLTKAVRRPFCQISLHGTFPVGSVGPESFSPVFLVLIKAALNCETYEWNGVGPSTHNDTEGSPSSKNAAMTTTRIPNWFHAADMNFLIAVDLYLLIMLIRRNQSI